MDELAPWIFTRSELDLFEDEFDRLMQLHEASEGRPWFPFETEVIQESIDHEEQEEAKTLLEMPLFEHHHHPPLSSLEEWQKRSFEHQLHDQMLHHPMFREASNWAQPMVRWCETQYVEQAQKDRVIFRIWLHTLLFVTKIALATQEVEVGDLVARKWCLTEMRLAHHALTVVLQDLIHLEQTKRSPFFARKAIERAQEMKRIMQHWIDHQRL